MNFQRLSKRNTDCTMKNKHEKNFRGKPLLTKLFKGKETNVDWIANVNIRFSIQPIY